MSDAGFNEVMRLLNASLGRLRRIEYGTPPGEYTERDDESTHVCDECGKQFAARYGHVRPGHWVRCSACWSDWQRDL
jgi:hypothetical protein